MNRLPLVACVVKECKPNGLGDMLINIKVIFYLVILVQFIIYLSLMWKMTMSRPNWYSQGKPTQ